MGGRAQIFELLAGEDVNCDQVDFGMTMFAGLGGAHFHDFAGTVLDDDVAVLAEGRALHRIGGGGAGIGALESVFMLLFRKARQSSRYLTVR